MWDFIHQRHPRATLLFQHYLVPGMVFTLRYDKCVNRIVWACSLFTMVLMACAYQKSISFWQHINQPMALILLKSNFRQKCPLEDRASKILYSSREILSIHCRHGFVCLFVFFFWSFNSMVIKVILTYFKMFAPGCHILGYCVMDHYSHFLLKI